MAERKPDPIYSSPRRPSCPVCGHPSYSLAGIHPQCATVAADKVQVARAAAKLLSKPVPFKLKRYEKRCPKCDRVVHVRLAKCGCGYALLSVNKVD
jgi:hypothetical protein